MRALFALFPALALALSACASLGIGGCGDRPAVAGGAGEEDLNWLKCRARTQDGEAAQYELALRYLNGSGGAGQKTDKALRLLERAAKVKYEQTMIYVP
ncbi:MAG: hypothetical protein R3360_09930, partial [Alphaproteobacteria bacterium]|nr:hypothetical protein [Alphaproteobacteria bacterium]